jgi:5-methylcytosine-specific restriction endonuclease McrA
MLHPGELRPTHRACSGCGTDISAKPGQARFCSKRCNEVASGKRRDAPPSPAECALPECGATFQPKKTGQRCCSEKHGKLLYNRESRADGRQKPGAWNDKRRDNYHRRRALKKDASTGEPVLFAAIAERDRWRCCLCRKAVSPTIKWPDSMSPSLDHLVPLSKGGAHDPSNVALAHLGCNSAKNNRGSGEQLLLIG